MLDCSAKRRRWRSSTTRTSCALGHGPDSDGKAVTHLLPSEYGRHLEGIVDLGHTLVRADRPAQAREQFDSARVMTGEMKDVDAGVLAWLHVGLGRLGWREGREAEACADYGRTLAIYDGVESPDPLALAVTQVGVARCLAGADPVRAAQLAGQAEPALRAAAAAGDRRDADELAVATELAHLGR